MMYDATPMFQHIGISRPPHVPALPSVGPSVANERLNSASIRKYFVAATGVLPGFGYALAQTIRMSVVAYGSVGGEKFTSLTCSEACAPPASWNDGQVFERAAGAR